MDVGQILTRIGNTIDFYDENAQEILDDPYMMQVLGDAVLDVKRTLKRPIAEKPVTLTAEERGFTLPSDWYDFPDEITPMRLDPDGHNSEGTIIYIVPEYAFYA